MFISLTVNHARTSHFYSNKPERKNIRQGLNPGGRVHRRESQGHGWNWGWMNIV